MRRVYTAQRVLVKGAVGALALLLCLTGCASGSTGAQSQPQASATSTLIPIPPTRTPIILAIHTISMGGFKAQLAIPGGPDGLLLYPATQTSFAGLPFISFYRYSDQMVERIATAPTESDGSQGGIIAGDYAGDWLSYVTEDSHQANWMLWIYNVKTGQRVQVDSQAGENHTAGWLGKMSNASDLVWAFFSPSSNGSSSLVSKMLDYSYATGQTRTLDTSSTELLEPRAMNAASVLFVQADVNGPNGSTWVQRLDQTAPTKIADGGGVNAWMSSRYAVWDDPHSGTTSLYNLSAGSLDPAFANCLRPAIADPNPYMVCVQFGSNSWLLVHVPDGAMTTFNAGQFSGGDGGQIYNGRVFIIGPNDAVQYFDLPTQ